MYKISTTRGIRAYLFLFLFLFGIPASSYVAAQSGEMPFTANKTAVSLFKRALIKADNLESPDTLFDQAVQNDPNFAFGYLFAGQTNVEAAKNLEKAVALAGKASPGEREWILSANAQNSGDLAASEVHLKNLQKLHPNDKRVLMQIGNYYRAVNDDATSLKYYIAASKVDKKYAPPYNIIGYSYVALGNFTEAEKAFKTYISLIPNNANPYDSYGEMLLNSGKFSESIKQYSLALAKDPTFYNSYQGMGNAYEYQGDHAKARETYQMMFDKSSTEALKALALASMTDSYVIEGRTSDAMKMIDRRVDLARAAGDFPTVFGLHQVAALVAIESGDFTTAASRLEAMEAVTSEPSMQTGNASNRTFALNAARGRLAIATGDNASARKQLDWMGAAKRNLNQERTYSFLQGYAELKAGHSAKASEFFSKGNPADPVLWYYQAQALESSNNVAGAAKLYRKIAALNQLDTIGYAIVRPRALAKINK